MHPMDEGPASTLSFKTYLSLLTDCQWLHNIQLKTSRGVLFLPPSDACVRNFHYLLYTLIKLYYTKALSDPASSGPGLNSLEAKNPGTFLFSNRLSENWKSVLSLKNCIFQKFSLKSTSCTSNYRKNYCVFLLQNERLMVSLRKKSCLNIFTFKHIKWLRFADGH